MNVLMLCGSPRAKHSTSDYLLRELKKQLGDSHRFLLCKATCPKGAADRMILNHIHDTQALVIAFPLYVDSIPASLLEVLQRIEQGLTDKPQNCTLYVLVNNGFYDAIQNHIAIHMLWKWGEKCGLKRGCALGLGAGEMIQMAPPGQGPSKNLGRALAQLAADMQTETQRDPVYVEPNFPRALYQTAAHMSWRTQAMHNGLKLSDIRRK